jgi:hypothetical protein
MRERAIVLNFRDGGSEVMYSVSPPRDGDTLMRGDQRWGISEVRTDDERTFTVTLGPPSTRAGNQVIWR